MAGATERLPEHLLSSSHPSKRPTGSQKITLLRGSQSPRHTTSQKAGKSSLFFSVVPLSSMGSILRRDPTASAVLVCLSTLPPSLPSICVIPARACNGPEGQTHAPSSGLDGPEILTLPGSPQASPALSKITKLPVPYCRFPPA